MSADKSLDAAREALKKARRLETEDETPAPGKAKKSARAAGGPMRLFAFWEKVETAADVVWNGWLKPVTQFLRPVTKRIVGFYRWSFRTFAYTGRRNERVFSRNRAGFTILALAIFTVIAPFVLVQQIIPAAARAVYDAGMLVTMKEDRLYLGRPDLINPDRELFQVMGCRDIRGCDGGDNTIYYRLRDNIIMDVKYWTTRFEPYDPAEIAGAMVSELNDCTIRYYGRRVKALGWYPYIVSASCTPV
ncbi:MAG: hypothetical protein KAH44_23275 [Oricola sp.]|jgi:hypothetical protein|nr:hypothetical protein [Oricola sp.]